MKIKNTAPRPDTKKHCYVNEMSQAGKNIFKASVCYRVVCRIAKELYKATMRKQTPQLKMGKNLNRKFTRICGWQISKSKEVQH